MPHREESLGKSVVMGTAACSDNSRSPLDPSSSCHQGPGEGMKGGPVGLSPGIRGPRLWVGGYQLGTLVPREAVPVPA